MAKILAFLLFVLTILLNYAPEALAATATPEAVALHLLNRLSLGPRPGDLEALQAQGVEAYIQTQLSPQHIAQPAALTQELSQLTALNITPLEAFQQYGPPLRTKGQKPDPAAFKAAHLHARDFASQAATGHLRQALESPRQLEQVMVDFWLNHFNVYAGKGFIGLWLGSYEETALRPHALGRFRDLLEATARHPAMLFYLDNWLNTDPGSPGAHGIFKGINENYAREIMELHTLGVNGGYTQADVITLAHILTGWGLCPRQDHRPADRSGFCFDPRRHDFSTKTFLGRKIPGSGIAEVEQALDMLAASPATAHHISYQLAQYFVADTPPASLVNHLSQVYLARQGDISAVLDALFHSQEFWDPQYFGNKFKTPYQYVVSALRVSGQPVENLLIAAGEMRVMGMPLYGCLPPDGYKNTQRAWLSPEAMTMRLSFATAWSQGRPPLHSALDPGQLTNTLGDSLSPHLRQVIAATPPHLQAALILGSPDFMYH